MQKAKEMKKSSVVGKLGKRLWDKYEKEWEEENQPGTSKRLREELVNSEHDDAANVIIEELPFLYVLEDDEDCLDSDDEDDSKEEKKEAFKD